MKDIRYLLSINELLDDSPEAEWLAERAYAKVDSERKQKLDGMKQGRKYAECLGAGLLLQLGLQEYRAEMADAGESQVLKGSASDELDTPESAKESVRYLTVSETIAQLKNLAEPEYTYGGKGKPYFRNIPIYFNISHSGEYVFCVFSEQEVGADIQYKKPLSNDRVVRRFFTAKEQEAWERCATVGEQEKLFYRLWARKEAYGKLTGDGVVTAMAVDARHGVPENHAVHDTFGIEENDNTVRASGVYWQDYEFLEDYQIAVCKRAGE